MRINTGKKLPRRGEPFDCFIQEGQQFPISGFWVVVSQECNQFFYLRVFSLNCETEHVATRFLWQLVQRG